MPVAEPSRPYDFSGIDGYDGFDRPTFAATIGNPQDDGYRYAAVYSDGTLVLKGFDKAYGSDGVQALLSLNPNSGVGYWNVGRYHRSSDVPLAIAKRMLTEAGAPESIIMPQDGALAHVDPNEGTGRGSERICTEIALKALQFSRWRNYDNAGRENYEAEERKTADDYAKALEVIVNRFGETVLAEEAVALIGLHFRTLHTSLHTPEITHKPHSDGWPEDEKFVATARQVINDAHDLPWTMHFGKIVNFTSLFGDPDFWATTRSAYPVVFHAAADHILTMPATFQQPDNQYCSGATINPVGLIRAFYPAAYSEVIAGRPDFVSDVPDGDVLVVRPLKNRGR